MADSNFFKGSGSKLKFVQIYDEKLIILDALNNNWIALKVTIFMKYGLQENNYQYT